MKNILFYKFVKIDDLPRLQRNIKALCIELKGKILLAEEGINGCVSGTEEEIEKFTAAIQQHLGSIEYKEGLTTKHTFKKMFVRIKPEIITFKQPVKVEDAAHYIEPKDLKQALDNGEEIIMLDARNLYESKIGKFKGAIIPNILLFSELPKILKDMPELKEKRIVTYCTGGIRCEKSSAWMRQNGFANVQQLHGGIIRYGEECGNAHWEGKCYVFDQRGAIDIDPKRPTTPITSCALCNVPCADYHNCANCICDKFFLCCKKCLLAHRSCCSDACEQKIVVNPIIRAATHVDEERPEQVLR